MKMTAIHPSDLDASLLRRWAEIQDASDDYRSPYFSSELTRAVACVRDDVRVLVLEDGARVVGFFPYQRDGAALSAVGGLLSDHHGVIAERGATWEWSAVLAAAKLLHWRFDHLVAAQVPRDAASVALATSPALDLSEGYSGYCARHEGSRRLPDLARKARKLAREAGPLRFVLCETSHAVLETAIAWKSEQCRRTGVLDYFSALPWTGALVHRLLDVSTPRFAGSLSVLYAGDTLVAANMGMRTERTWHWWLPVYDHAFAKSSPGTLLLTRLAEGAASLGATLLDLGKGQEPYKQAFADTAITVAEGFVGSSPVWTKIYGTSISTQRWLRTSTVLEPLKPAMRSLRRWRERLRTQQANEQR